MMPGTRIPTLSAGVPGVTLASLVMLAVPPQPRLFHHHTAPA